MPGNCINCKHKCTQYSDITDVIAADMTHISGTMYGRCLKGKTDVLVQFFCAYGDRPVRELDKVNLPCFEPTEAQHLLEGLVNSVNNLLSSMQQPKKADS
jgi:hypothetical protein